MRSTLSLRLHFCLLPFYFCLHFSSGDLCSPSIPAAPSICSTPPLIAPMTAPAAAPIRTSPAMSLALPRILLATLFFAPFFAPPFLPPPFFLAPPFLAPPFFAPPLPADFLAPPFAEDL